MKLIKIISTLAFLLMFFSAFTQYSFNSDEITASINNKERIKGNKTLDSLFTHVPIKDSVKKYYKYVYKAEADLMNNKFEEAAKTYSKAFKYLKYPFSKDLRRAIESELKSTNNKENIIRYCRFLKNKGMGILDDELKKWIIGRI